MNGPPTRKRKSISRKLSVNQELLDDIDKFLESFEENKRETHTLNITKIDDLLDQLKGICEENPVINADTQIDEVIYSIMKTHRYNNILKWIQVLKDNYIFTQKDLLSLSPENIRKLKLPIIMENEIVKLIDENKMHKYNDKLTMEQKLKHSWEYIKNDNFIPFIEQVYDIYFKLDPEMAKLFIPLNANKKYAVVFSIIKLILLCIDGEEKSIYGEEYLTKTSFGFIMNGIEKMNFGIFAFAFSTLVKNEIDEIRNAWNNQIVTMGNKITDECSVIKNGVMIKGFYIEKNLFSEKYRKCYVMIMYNEIMIVHNHKVIIQFDIKDMSLIDNSNDNVIEIITNKYDSHKLSFDSSEKKNLFSSLVKRYVGYLGIE